MPTFYIAPGAVAGGDGSLARPYNNWSFGPLKPGSTYLQKAGTTFTGTLNIQASGTQATPILIGSYGAGAPPVIKGAVNFSGASHVRLANFAISNPSGAAVLIQNGSHHVEVSSNTISGSASGIWMGNKVGGDNRIISNSILNSKDIGIAVNGSTAVAGHENVITRNLVSGSGNDGIHINSNFTSVLSNQVSGNGVAENGYGTSGIHVYTEGANTGFGDFNRIEGNIVTDQHDRLMQDGNGIQLDQWCDNNIVSRNLTIGNDGAGIALYDSAHNAITYNTSGANAVDAGRTHSIKAEISINQVLGLSHDNTMRGNMFLASRPGAVAAFVDAQSALLAAHNSFSGDMLKNLIGGSLFRVSETTGSNLAHWDKIFGAGGSSTSIPISAPAAATSYDYTFPAGTFAPIDGRTVHLTGWTAAQGLFGTW